MNLPPSTYQALLTGFTGVVQSRGGTAYTTFQGLNFPGGLAGKTGTADTVAGKEPTAWFVGFGPTADPQYVVVCVIDQAGYGATAAAPVVRDIFSYLATHPIGPAAVPPAQQQVRATQGDPAPDDHGRFADHHRSGRLSSLARDATRAGRDRTGQRIA